MIKNTIDYDFLYTSEYQLNYNKHFEEIKTVLESNTIRSNSNMKKIIVVELKNSSIALTGYMKGQNEHFDQYFAWLISYVAKASNDYAIKPITHYLEYEFQAFKDSCKGMKHERPDIYELNPADTIKHIAAFDALKRLHDKAGETSWPEEESVEMFLNKLRDRQVSMNGKDMETPQNELIDDKTKKVLNSPTTHAVAYFLLSRADHKEFLWDDRSMELYLQKINPKIPEPLYKKIDLKTFIRTVYNMGDDEYLAKVRLASLKAAKLIINTYNSEEASDKINSLIAAKKQ